MTVAGVIADMTGSHDASGQTGAGGIIVDGPGTLALSAANTFTGGAKITEGTLELTGAGSLDPSGTISGAGTFEIAGGAMTFETGASLTVANVTQTAATSLVTVAEPTLTYAKVWTQTAGNGVGFVRRPGELHRQGRCLRRHAHRGRDDRPLPAARTP